MKDNKKLNQTYFQWLICGLVIAFCMINLGCNKDDGDDNEAPDEYYVKYLVNSSTIYSGGKLNVTINTEKNTNTTFTVNQNANWETIIGPVSKGFGAKLSVTAVGNTFNKLKLYTEIHVSKNTSPFAMKVINGSDTPRDSVQLSYTIDY